MSIIFMVYMIGFEAIAKARFKHMYPHVSG